MTEETAVRLFRDDIKEIKSDVKSILEKANEDKLAQVRTCNNYREHFHSDLEATNKRVNTLFTIGGVALFLFGVVIKLGWI